MGLTFAGVRLGVSLLEQADEPQQFDIYGSP